MNDYIRLPSTPIIRPRRIISQKTSQPNNKLDNQNFIYTPTNITNSEKLCCQLLKQALDKNNLEHSKECLPMISSNKSVFTYTPTTEMNSPEKN